MSSSTYRRGAWAFHGAQNTQLHDEDDDEDDYDDISESSDCEPISLFERDQGFNDYRQGKTYLRLIQGQELVQSGFELSPMAADVS